MGRRLSLCGAALAGSLLLLLVTGAAWATTATPGTAKQVKALVAASVKIDKLSSTLAAELPGASSDNVGQKYDLPNSCGTATSCVFGDTTSSQSVVLYGDSHMRMWLPAIIPIATNDRLKLILIGADGCPIVSIDFKQSEFAGCDALQSGYLATIKAIDPSVLIVSDRTSYSYFTNAQWQKGLEATIDALSAKGRKIAIIGDIQVAAINVIQCLAAYPTKVEHCSTTNPNTTIPGHEKAEHAVAAATRSLYIDPTPWLCTSNHCSAVIGSFIAYWNSYHVSVAYAQYLSGVMGTALKSTL
jgi:hypothetical protein